MSIVERCKTVGALSELLDSGDDSRHQSSVAERGNAAISLRKERNLKMKRAVLALAKLEGRERKSNETLSQEKQEKDESISKLENEMTGIREGIESLDSALKSLEISIKEIESEGAKVRGEKSLVQQNVTDALPKTKYSFSLYSNITRLRWDYDSQDGDKLQGFVTSLRDVRPFSLDLNEHSPHFVANYLWDLIASAKSC